MKDGEATVVDPDGSRHRIVQQRGNAGDGQSPIELDQGALGAVTRGHFHLACDMGERQSVKAFALPGKPTMIHERRRAMSEAAWPQPASKVRRRPWEAQDGAM